MIKYLLIALLSFGVAANECELPKQVSLSFDDGGAVDSIYDNLYLFERYNAKVTFYVSKWKTLSLEQIKKIYAIQAAGHEIGNHGLWHKAALDYTPEHYKAEQVDSMIPYMREAGLGVHTFAYPFGSRSPLHDAELLKDYRYVRGFTSAYNEILPSSKPTLTAYSIDSHRINLNLVYNAMDTLNGGDTIYLTSHVIGEWVNEWHITKENLEAILSYGNSAGVRFCSVRDC